MARSNIKHIAELAGVSVASVSYVINGKPGVSEDTRRRILEIIRKEHYTPNVNSRRLILKKSFNLFVVINDAASCEDLFYTSVLSAILTESRRLGYNIVLSTREKKFEESSAADAVRQGNTDGIIFTRDIDGDTLFQLRNLGVPFVVLDSHRTDPGYPIVTVDIRRAAYTSTEFLIKNGHTKIGYIGISSIPDFYLATFAGFSSAMEAHGLSLNPAWLRSTAKNESSAGDCMREILSSENTPTAVFCANDILAIGAMNAARAAGRSIPDDLSFTAIDDIIMSCNYYPGLTTVRIDKHDLGRQAVLMLDGMISGRDVPEVYLGISDDLVVRGSVRYLDS